MSGGAPLTRDDLLRLLDLLETEAERSGLRVELFVVGGAAMALADDTARTTDDLDGVFVPKSEVHEDDLRRLWPCAASSRPTTRWT